MKIKANADARFYFELAIFATFKIFSHVSGVRNETVITPTKVEEAIQPHVIEKKETANVNSQSSVLLPDLDTVFKTSEFVVAPKAEEPLTAAPKVEEQVAVNAVVTPITPLDDLFNEIAYNYANEFKIRADSFLNEVKQMANPGLLSFMIPANKVLIASKNGMVLMFDDEIDAELLNNKFKQYDFINNLRKHFGQPIYVFGFNRQKLLELSNRFKESKKLGQSFNEPNITPLMEILKNNNSVEQVALEIFGK
jgi:hypothetical protein